MGPDHPLHNLVCQCFENISEKKPSAAEIIAILLKFTKVVEGKLSDNPGREKVETMSRIRHDHKVKVLVLGQSSVGKTSIVSWFLDAIVRSQIHHFQVAWNRKITLSVCEFETSQSIFPWSTILAGTGSGPQPTLRRRYSTGSEARSSCSISPPK